jgi:hypothetical protein
VRSSPSSAHVTTGSNAQTINAALVKALSGGASGEGTVLRYSSSDASALVLFGDAGDSDATETPVEVLAAVDEVPPSFRGLAVSGDRLIRTLKRMVQVSPSGGSVAVTVDPDAGDVTGSSFRILRGSLSAADLWRLQIRCRASMVVLRLVEQVRGRAMAARVGRVVHAHACCCPASDASPPSSHAAVAMVSLQEPKFVREALHHDVLPKLFDAALHPVQFWGFLDLPSLEYQCVTLDARLLELAAGHVQLLSGVVRGDAVSDGADRVPSAITPSERHDPDAARWELARKLQVRRAVVRACLR